jgi:hypothetical protein
LECPVFDLEREKWQSRLAVSTGGNDGLFRLGLDPSGGREVIFYTAVFVSDVLKTVRKRYIRN